MNLLFNITYGLYFLSASDGERKNACIINTLSQQTSKPELLSVTVNKANLTHDMILSTGKCAVAILSQEAEFSLFRNFGMQSGKDVDKFATAGDLIKTPSGFLIPAKGVVGYFETEVQSSYDFGTHTMFTLKPQNSVVVKEVAPVTYSYYQSNIKPKPAALQAQQSGERWVCSVCGYVHEGSLPEDFVCPLCKHTAQDFQRVDGYQGEKTNNQNQRRSEMKKWRCTVCGEIVESETRPDQCPRCKVPGEKFVEVKEEELNWAAEHVVGIAKGVDKEIVDGLRGNFEGECSEVGMYLAMARVAYREGYPEIGLYWEKAAFEEAEHAAKFAELLGECLTDSTKKNLEMRVAAENGATAGKTALAKRAKELGLDAIHDTVHEMARDEARHGKALKGLLDRYFK